MAADCSHDVLYAVSTLALYLTVDYVSKSLKLLDNGSGYFVAGSPFLQAFGFPLMILDTVVVVTLVTASVYAAVVTDVTRYPMLYTDGAQPHWIIICIVAVNLGRYVSKLVVAVHNRPAAGIAHPVAVCLTYLAFLAVSLHYRMFCGFCLIGVLSESAKLLKWLQYLPHGAASTSWFTALLICKYCVTFLAKGVIAIALSILVCLVQFQEFYRHVGLPYTVLSLLLAAGVMLINLGHVAVFTTFLMEHLRSKTVGYSGRWLIHTSRQNTAVMRGALNDSVDKTPATYSKAHLQYVKNQFGEADVKTAKPIKEKNCNVDMDKQLCVVVSEKASNEKKAGRKTAVPGRVQARQAPMVTIDEEE